MAHILIIEDNLDLMGIFADFLNATGNTVVLASGGKEGLQRFNAESFDLVITDMMMPDMDGAQVIAEARNKVPDQKIIAISGGGKFRGEQYLEMAKRLGANRTLIKPFGLAELSATINAVLG